MFRRRPKVSIRTAVILTYCARELEPSQRVCPGERRERGRHGLDPARLGGFISTTSPGKVIIERDDYQSLFRALFDGGRHVKTQMT